MKYFRRAVPFALAFGLGASLSSGFKLMKVELNSMAPTIRQGDWILVARTDGDAENVPEQRGSIVIALQQDRYIVKRMIAQAGDVVETREAGEIFVNAKFVPTRAAPSQGTAARKTITKIRVPSGYAFVVGDNSFESVDSRSFGVIPIRSIKGHPIVLWRPWLEFSGLREGSYDQGEETWH